MEAEETKWLRHYSNKQKILLVGEGDFSFALSLARAFGSATNLTASSLDTLGELEHKFKDRKANVEELERIWCSVVFGVNVHSMTTKPSLVGSVLYDRVIFNFPHTGFDIFGREHAIKTILRHQELVRGFMKSARVLMKDEDKGGDIHVTHKTEYPFSEWKVKTLGEKEGLDLIREIEFSLSHFPGYSNKRGSGGYSDSSFLLANLLHSFLRSNSSFTKQFICIVTFIWILQVFF